MRRFLCLVAALALLAAGVADAGLVSHWTLDDAVGTDPIVDSVSGYDAAQTGTPELGIPGKAGTAGSFPSGANYYRAAANPAFNQGELTFSFWFNPLNSGGGGHNVALATRDGENGFIVYQRNEGIEFWLRHTGSGWQQQTQLITRGVDEWCHVVGSYDPDGGIKKFYVTPASQANATVDDTMSGATIQLHGSGPRFGIGVRGDGGLPLNGGYIDDVQFYDVALSDSEVNYLFHNPGQGIPTWDGSPGTWNTASSWSTGTVPNLATGSESAFIESGTVTYTPGDDFIIDNGNTLHLGGTGTFVKSAPNWIRIGESSEGTVSQTGGTFDASAVNNIRLGFDGSGVGNYDLDGGTLIVKNIDQGAGAANFSFGGGTLEAAASFTTALPMTINDGGATVDTNANTVTLSGVLSAGAGSGGLTKLGTGTLILSGNNTYTGGTLVDAGTLRATNFAGNGLGTGPVTVNSGAMLDLSTVNVANDIILNGGTMWTAGGASGTITLNNVPGNKINANGYYHVLSGQITGAGGVTFGGINTPGIALSNPANDFQGDIVVNAGADLRLDADEVIPDTAKVTLNGSLRLEGNGRTETIGELAGGGDIFALNGPGISTLRVGAGNATGSYSGAIGSHGDRDIHIEKIGTGTLTLAGNNIRYIGGTTIHDGTLHLRDTNGADFRDSHFNNNGALILETNSPQHYGISISGTGSFTKTGSSSLRLWGDGLRTHTGPTYINQHWVDSYNHNVMSAGSDLYLTGGNWNMRNMNAVVKSLNGTGIVRNTGTLTVGANDGSGTFSGSLETGASGGVLIKNGSGTQTLVGNSILYTGGTTIHDGTLHLRDTNGGGFRDSHFTNNGALILETNSPQHYGISISGTGSFTKTGSSSLRLWGDGLRTHTGPTYINQHWVDSYNHNVMSAGSDLYLTGGNWNMRNMNAVVKSLNGTGIVRSTGTLTVGANDGSGTFSGTIEAGASGGSLVKIGSGTQTLSGGSNSYTGLTRVDNGTLEAGGSFGGDGGIQGDITINSGGTFKLLQSNIIKNTSLITVNPGGTFDANGQSEAYAYLAGGGAVTHFSSTFELDLGGAGPQTFSGSISGGGGLLRVRGNNGGGTQILTGTADLGGIQVYRGSSGTTALELAGSGTTAVSGGVGLGYGGSGTAQLNVKDTHALTIGGSLLLGEYSGNAGTINQSGGTVTIGGETRVGHWSNETSTYTLSGTGNLIANGGFNVGWDGTGIFTQTGGTSAFNGGLAIRTLGTVELAGNGTSTASWIGMGYNGNGAMLRIKDTHHLTTGNLFVGEYNTAGTIEQSGGFVEVTNQLRLGHWGNQVNRYTLSDGELHLTGTPSGGGPEYAGILHIGVDGTGEFTQTGGNASAYGISLDNRWATAGTDTFTLDGGTFTVGPWGIYPGWSGAASTYQINLGGGTLGASADWSSYLAMALTGAVGNATVDTGVHNVALSGVLSGPGGLVKEGDGTLTLSGQNTFAGGLTIDGGTVDFNGPAYANAIGGGMITINNGLLNVNPVNAISNVDFTINQGGTLNVAGYHEHVNNVALNGGTITGTGSGKYAGEDFMLDGDVTVGGSAPSLISLPNGMGMNGTRTFNVGDATGDANADLTIAGVIRNGGMSKTGAGTLTLSGHNTFSGGLTVDDGTVLLAGGRWYAPPAQGWGTMVINPGATVVNWDAHAFGGAPEADGRSMIINGGTFQLRAETYVDDITMTAGTVSQYPGASGDLRTKLYGGTVIATLPAATSSEISARLNFVSSPTFNVAAGQAADDLVVSGPMFGGGGFTKTGDGTMVLSGDNTYGGATAVTAGTLLLDGTHTGGAAYAVAGDATLGGSGSTESAVNVAANGILAPGGGADTAVFSTGPLTLAVDAIFEVALTGPDVGSQYDQLAVTGSVSLEDAVLEVLLGFAPAPGEMFTILENDESDPIGGVFAGLPEGAEVRASNDPSHMFWISYVGGEGANDVVLLVAPEPTTLALLGLGGLAALIRRRRKR